MTQTLRQHAEQQFAEELEALQKADTRERPENWAMSPWAVANYLLGCKLDNGFEISPKYIGSRRIIETAVATLATDRALLLFGVPGTAKSWVSEHLAAAISGDSTMLIQGTAGTSEEQLRYGWNYAQLLSKGPSRDALVPSPLMRAMELGKTARVEELTRIPADVQDTLITILSEKSLPVPELGIEAQAIRGFNVIATANNRDKGINELSSALKRRFNTVILPVPANEAEEVAIVTKRVGELGRALQLPGEPPALAEVRRVVQIFRELRNGQTEDGKTRLKSPSSTLSTAEAISVLNSGMAMAGHFGDGVLRASDVAASLVGAIVKDPVQDTVVWREYQETVMKERSDWKDLYRACRDQE
jgi:MoxR-like ATPase